MDKRNDTRRECDGRRIPLMVMEEMAVRKFKVIVVLVLALMVPTRVFAQASTGIKKHAAAIVLSGFAAIGTGAVLIYKAYDYTGAHCPRGASTYRVTVPSSYGGSKREDVCVSTYRGGGSIYTADEGGVPGKWTLARPTYLKWGVGMLSGGAVAVALPFILPDKAAKAAPTVVLTPKGITASRTFTF